MLASVHWIGLTIATIALCGWVIVRAVRVPRTVRGQSLCGRCGHELVASDRCPECGLGVLAAGIKSPALLLRTRSSLPAALVAWSIMVFSIGMPAWLLWNLHVRLPAQGNMNVPWRYSNTYSTTYTHFDRDAGYMVGYEHALETLESDSADAGVIRLILNVGSPEILTIEIEAPGRSFRAMNEDGEILVRGERFNAGAVAPLLRQAGVSVNDAVLSQHAQILSELVESSIVQPGAMELQPGGATGFTSSGGSGNRAALWTQAPQRDPWLGPYAFLGGFGLAWCGGIALIIWLRSRALRVADAAQLVSSSPK